MQKWLKMTSVRILSYLVYGLSMAARFTQYVLHKNPFYNIMFVTLNHNIQTNENVLKLGLSSCVVLILLVSQKSGLHTEIYGF